MELTKFTADVAEGRFPSAPTAGSTTRKRLWSDILAEPVRSSAIAPDKSEDDSDGPDDESDDASDASEQASGCSSLELWQAAVKQQTARGHRKDVAEANADRLYPGLRLDMFTETGDHRGLWQAAFKAETAKGVSPSQALKNVEKSHPGLRAKMLAQANQ